MEFVGLGSAGLIGVMGPSWRPRAFLASARRYSCPLYPSDRLAGSY